MADPAQPTGTDASSTYRMLAIETTCDETGVAVLEGPRPRNTGDTPAPYPIPRVASSVVASQVDLHERFGGVVPEIASRAHVRQLLPLIDQAVHEAGLESLHAIDAVAVATRPGLVGSLIVGLTAAKTIAWALDLPLVAVDHLEAHLYACQLTHPDRDVYPNLGLVVSGGHTSLYACTSPVHAELLGGTIDDAAGEAFDKVAAMLGLGYPGGPSIERAARTGRRDAFAFPRALVHDHRIAFSFSGLKTAVLYTLEGKAGNPGKGTRDPDTGKPDIADIAASFQEAVLDALIIKTRQALRKTRSERLCVGGGVAANARFRERLDDLAAREGIEVLIPPLSLCTDNAAMLGVAFPKLAAGQTVGLDADVQAGLVRPGRPLDGTHGPR